MAKMWPKNFFFFFFFFFFGFFFFYPLFFFYYCINKWPKCGKKTFFFFFFAYFVSFFVYTLLFSMSYTTRFCQMKYLIKICMYSMFHQCSIYLIVKLKIVKVSCTDSTSKKWPFFWSSLGPNLILENQKYCLKPKFIQKLHP